jgi:hypothetical protein
MKGHVYKRGSAWSYIFDIDPDPLTGKRRQAKRKRLRDRESCLASLPDSAQGVRGRTARPAV